MVLVFIDTAQALKKRWRGLPDAEEKFRAEAAEQVADFRGERKKHASFYAEILPLDEYVELYDRALRGTFWQRDHSPWRPTWRFRDELKLAWRRGWSAGSGQPPDEVLRFDEERSLRDGTFTDIDRPGDLPPATAAPLQGFVALDIAVRGRSLNGTNLDNLAHSVLIPFEEELCIRPGTVIAYRAYEAVGVPEGVQVRVVDASRFNELDIKLSEARDGPTLPERINRRFDALAKRAGPVS